MGTVVIFSSLVCVCVCLEIDFPFLTGGAIIICVIVSFHVSHTSESIARDDTSILMKFPFQRKDTFGYKRISRCHSRQVSVSNLNRKDVDGARSNRKAFHSGAIRSGSEKC